MAQTLFILSAANPPKVPELDLQELERVGGREELDRMVKDHNLATSARK
jgi:hypothetical protein